MGKSRPAWTAFHIILCSLVCFKKASTAVRSLLAIRSRCYEFLLSRFLTAFTRTGQPIATLSGVSQQPLEAVLALRSSGQALYLEGFDPPNIPGDPGTDVWNGGDPFGSVLSELHKYVTCT
jgi:hypothetical protein